MNKLIKLLPKKIKNLRLINIFWVFFYLFLLGLLINNSLSYFDPDFGWHLKVGQEISYSHLVPEANTYNYTYTGNWVDHEWLSNLILYNIYNNFGYPIVTIVFSALIIITLIILNLFVSHKSNQKFWLIAIFQFLGVLASLPHFGIRLQELALLFILLLLIIINYYSKTKNWKVLILLPPLIFAWANLHASFLISFFILFSWIFIKIFEHFKFTKKIKWLDFSETSQLKQIYLFALATITSFAATCFTPYGFKLYSFLIGYQNKAYLSLIEEWLPQTALPLNIFQLLYLALGTISLAFYIYYNLQKKQKINIWKIFLPLAFLLMSFSSKRHFPLFFIVSFELIITTLTIFFAQIKIPYAKYLKILIVVCLGLIMGLSFLQIRLIINPFNSFCKDYPCEAVDFLRNNPQYNNYNLFNEYSWGGFLIWTLPDRKLFIDGRLPQVNFSKWTFVEEYHDFIKNKPDIPNKLKKYNIKLVLIKSNYKSYTIKPWEKLFVPIKDSATSSKNELKEYLDQSPDWKIIYQDNIAKIYFYRQ